MKWIPYNFKEMRSTDARFNGTYQRLIHDVVIAEIKFKNGYYHGHCEFLMGNGYLEKCVILRKLKSYGEALLYDMKNISNIDWEQPFL